MILIAEIESKTTNYELCAKCGGACCKRHPGSYIPGDFDDNITVDFIYQLLYNRTIIIERAIMTNNDKNIIGVRPRSIKDPKDSYFTDMSYSNKTCSNWNADTGCSLDYASRPYQCRMLVPEVNRKGAYVCSYRPQDGLTVKDISNLWHNYKDILEEALRKLDNDVIL